MKTPLVWVVGAILLLCVGYVVVLRAEVPERKASQEFQFEIVNTAATREQGLSDRRDVPHNYGMLFVFDKADRYGFWMKDMYVPIDMLWLADDGTILGIDEAVDPSTYPTPFYPPSPVRLVLETRAGEARFQGWEVGERISLPVY